MHWSDNHVLTNGFLLFCRDEELVAIMSSPEVVEVPPSSPEVVEVPPPPPQRRGHKVKPGWWHPARE